MFTILLVDDERGISEGLQFILQSAGRDWEIAGIAEDGQEGFEMAMERNPDIVISDVRMPVVDGLAMIEKLKDAGSSAKCILLSGYSEFEYARQGIRLGVKFYICKPVEEEELFEVMEKVCAEIALERSSRKQLIDLEHRVADFEKDKREICFFRFLTGEMRAEEMGDALTEYGIPLDAVSYLIVLWECNSSDFLSGEYFRELEREISLQLGEYHCVRGVRISNIRAAVLLAEYNMLQEEKLIRQLSSIKEKMEEKYDMPVSVGVGSNAASYREIADSYEKAGIALNNKVVQGIGSIISYSQMGQGMCGKVTMTEAEITELEQAINRSDDAACKRIVRKMFQKMRRQEGLTLFDLQMQSMNLILAGIRTMPFMQFQLNEYVGRNILSLESISRFHTIEQLENWMINIMTGIMEIRRSQDAGKRQDVIRQIKDYIGAHYTKEISLNELAGKFFLNPYYLSQMFKKKTGMTYQSYVTSLRVEKAKQLFREKDYKVYEVCEMVGYSDTAYFSRVFEKAEGCKPSEYRRLITERQGK